MCHFASGRLGGLFSFTYLANDDFAIISLEVKSPCGSDEAVGLTHYIIPETSDQSQWVQKVNLRHHALQLGEKKTNKHIEQRIVLKVGAEVQQIQNQERSNS